MTEGIISGINRDISHNGVTNSLLQTSAPINEGNSGGALVNVYGQVVGVTNMKMSSQYIGSVSIEGVAFAIPSSTVKTIADSLLESGEVRGRPGARTHRRQDTAGRRWRNTISPPAFT